MAEIKNFLSLNGLQHYDAKIKAFIASQDKDVTDKLMALIGAAEEGNKKTILARVKDLETAVGDVKNLPGEVKELVAAILGEATRAQAAEKGLGDRLNIIEGEGEGSIKKALADANAHTDELNTAMDSRVGALETAIGDGGSVADQINTAIEALDANITSAAVAAGNGIQVQVVETDGKVTGVNVTGNFDNKYDASGAAATVNSALETYKETNNAAVAAAKKAGDDAQSDLNTYKGTVSTTYETKTDATAKLTEAKGYTDTEIGKVNTKIGTVAEGKTVVGLINEAKQAAIDEASYDDTQVKADIAANKSAIDAVKADYLKASDKTELTNTINANKNILDAVKEDVDAFFADADLTAQAKDTLKEIQEYINSDATAAAEMTASIQNNSSEISALKTKVGAIPGGATATDVVGYINEKVATETARAEGVESGLDTRLVAVEAKLGDGEGSVNAKIEAAKNEAISTATTKADNALKEAKSYVDGKLGNVGEEKGTVTARINAIEEELAAAVTFEAISEEQINALFGNK